MLDAICAVPSMAVVDVGAGASRQAGALLRQVRDLLTYHANSKRRASTSTPRSAGWAAPYRRYTADVLAA
jgi:hypothetical protein